MKLYAAKRVMEVEATAEFRARRARADHRSSAIRRGRQLAKTGVPGAAA
jgi:hypothetical protein